MRRIRVAFTLCVAAVALSWAGDGSVVTFYSFSVGRKTGWDAILEVNGNPFLRFGGTGTGFQDVTAAFRKGHNKVRITAKWTGPKSTEEDCEILLVKMPTGGGAVGPEAVGGIQGEADTAIPVVVEFDVDCPNDVGWIWQKADMLDKFTDQDRAQIAALLARMTKALERRDIVGFYGLITDWWGDGTPPPGVFPPSVDYAKQIRESIKDLSRWAKECTDYVVTTAKREEITTSVGRQVVMLSVAPPPFEPAQLKEGMVSTFVIRASSASIGKVPSAGTFASWTAVGYERLFFVRIAGKWRCVAVR